MWGAAPASIATLEALARTYPGVDIVSAYGQTELSGATTLLKGVDSTRKMGSVGLPMRDVELELVDVTDGVGEIVYRGPFVMRGYWNQPDVEGWFHSGDLATRDDEGYLRLVDRKKDMIVSGGENIYPAEVERVLREYPAVDDVAVVGFPHPRWGETPVAFVVGLGCGGGGAHRALPGASGELQEADRGALRFVAAPECRGQGLEASAAPVAVTASRPSTHASRGPGAARPGGLRPVLTDSP